MARGPTQSKRWFDVLPHSEAETRIEIESRRIEMRKSWTYTQRFPGPRVYPSSTSFRHSIPGSLSQENMRMRISQSSSSPASDEEQENSYEDSHQITETTEMLGRGQDLPESIPLTTAHISDGSGNHVDINDTHPSKNPRLAVKQFPHSQTNHQFVRYNHASKKKKFYCSEDNSSVGGITRGVKFSTESCTGRTKRASLTDSTRDTQVFEPSRRQMKKASIVSQSSSIPDRSGNEKFQCHVQNNCNPHHYTSVAPEFHHLMQGSNCGHEDDKKQQDGDPEITWHDIGNSLDRSLFWVFFLFTNTVTVVILVLFVRDD
ncbi:hypothetical protein PoB_001884900 [Plakobranchus ocellatus]|uniref:Uncharacterized protein n=1 Tax=Plakobranchus ocellatus TaxID=259542 RepID=A0AAV3ZD76_9GAST|nr:hypothetical protein PoB_001884900 [Plakobranchus ocellatus]